MTGHATSKGREPLWTKRFLLLLSSAVFMYVMTFMLTPTLPIFANDISVGTVASTGGIIVAAYTLGSLLLRLLWGKLTDTWGRKQVYLLGVFIVLVLSPFFGVASILPAIVALRLVQGIGFSASSTSASTLAADIVPATRRAEGIGYYALANTLGMALGPEFGIQILQNFGQRWLFVASTISGIVAVLIGMLVSTKRTVRVKAVTVQSARNRASEASAHRRLSLIESKALPSSAVLLFVIMPYGAVMAYIGAYGLHQGVANIGLYFSVFAIALLVVRLSVGHISDTFGVTVVFMPAAVLMFAGLLILLWATELPVFLASAVLFGLGFGIAMPVLQASAYTLNPDERRGAASATVFAVSDIAYGIGALALGVAIAHWGYPIAFAALCVFDVIAVTLFVLILRPLLLKSSLQHDAQH